MEYNRLQQQPTLFCSHDPCFGLAIMSTSAGNSRAPEPENAIILGPRWYRAIVPLLLAGIAALAWAIYPGQWAACLTVIATAWIAAYRLGCDRIGVLLWCLAAGLASSPLCIVITRGTSDDFARLKPFTAAAFLLLIATGVRFFWVLRKTAVARGANAAMIVVALFTLIVPAIVGSMISRTREYEEEYQETTLMLLGIHQVGSDVDSFRTAQGRLPKDEAEVAAWRGSPMPSWGRHGAVHYQAYGGGQYRLDTLVSHFWGRGWDIFGYIVSSSGPQSAMPLHVELF
jgi:hypothetical protein